MRSLGNVSIWAQCISNSVSTLGKDSRFCTSKHNVWLGIRCVCGCVCVCVCVLSLYQPESNWLTTMTGLFCLHHLSVPPIIYLSAFFRCKQTYWWGSGSSNTGQKSLFVLRQTLWQFSWGPSHWLVCDQVVPSYNASNWVTSGPKVLGGK